MMKKQIPILLIIYQLFLFECNAQSSINTSSLHGTIGNLKLDASIGELALISTDQCHSLIVTQGYLQPSLKTKSTMQSNLNEASTIIKVYPNPTQHFLNIEFQTSSNSVVLLCLQNSIGQTLIKKNLMTSSDNFSYQLDLTPYADGDYYLSITSDDNKHLKNKSSFKIQKIKHS